MTDVRDHDAAIMRSRHLSTCRQLCPVNWFQGERQFVTLISSTNFRERHEAPRGRFQNDRTNKKGRNSGWAPLPSLNLRAATFSASRSPRTKREKEHLRLPFTSSRVSPAETVRKRLNGRAKCIIRPTESEFGHSLIPY